jgi:hypothetical protein
MILVYCDHITERHRYIFDFIFGDVLVSGYRLTDRRAEFLAFDGAKICYANEKIEGGLYFKPHPLLNENGVKYQDIKVARWNDLPVFFGVEGPSAWPFDPFSVSFYLITRYEEYLPFEPDEHGRFRPELSLAYREDFLRMPLVDAIVSQLKSLLIMKFPGLDLPGRPFRFLPTFDIDIAFAHSAKGWPRATAAWMKLLLKGDFLQIKERVRTLLGQMPDPYNNFRLQIDLAAIYGHPLIYFALLGDFSRYDKNNTHRSRKFRDLLSGLNQSAEMGLHPSYQSYLHPEILKKEKQRLEDIIQRPVTKSRFHYLRVKFPESFRILISENIKDDYSLGYSSMNGFRAGTCTPFYFYDLEKEERTDLRMHPFLFMDSAMIEHLKLTPESAIETIRELVNHVEKYGGEAVGIWHNYSLSEKGQFKGWEDVLISVFKQYEKILA